MTALMLKSWEMLPPAKHFLAAALVSTSENPCLHKNSVKNYMSYKNPWCRCRLGLIPFMLLLLEITTLPRMKFKAGDLRLILCLLLFIAAISIAAVILAQTRATPTPRPRPFPCPPHCEGTPIGTTPLPNS